MLEKGTSLLICAAVLLASAPAKAFAQSAAPSAAERSGKGGVSDGQIKPKSDLKTAVAEVLARSRVDTATLADVKRLERARLQNTAKDYGDMTRKEKILGYSIVAGLLVLAGVSGFKKGEGGRLGFGQTPTGPR